MPSEEKVVPEEKAKKKNEKNTKEKLAPAKVSASQVRSAGHFFEQYVLLILRLSLALAESFGIHGCT